jgi:putative endonuclease
MDDRRRKEAGVAGESIALEFLRSQGLGLIERNYRCRGGEIDLVMLQEKTLVLVEVRFRSSTDFGGGAASVTWHKQRRLITAARHLMLSRADLRRYPARFDVIAVSPGNGKPQVNWIRNAFTL